MKNNPYMQMSGGKLSFLYHKKTILVLLGFLTLLLAAVTLSLSLGENFYSPAAVVASLLGFGEEMARMVIWEFRAPRVLVAFLGGMALGLAGATVQGVVRNPLASPHLLGIVYGGAAGAMLFHYFFTDRMNDSLTVPIAWMPLFTFAGALLMTLMILTLFLRRQVSSIHLILVGLALSGLAKGITTLFLLGSNLYVRTQAHLWLTGTVYGANWRNVLFLALWIFPLLALLPAVARRLNVKSFDDTTARTLGLTLKKSSAGCLLFSALLAAGAVSFCGGIGFVGLMAPHVARRLINPSYGGLLPLSGLLGALLVVLADIPARLLFYPVELPTGIFTALAGAPFFIYLLLREKR